MKIYLVLVALVALGACKKAAETDPDGSTQGAASEPKSSPSSEALAARCAVAQRNVDECQKQCGWTRDPPGAARPSADTHLMLFKAECAEGCEAKHKVAGCPASEPAARLPDPVGDAGVLKRADANRYSITEPGEADKDGKILATARCRSISDIADGFGKCETVSAPKGFKPRWEQIRWVGYGYGQSGVSCMLLNDDDKAKGQPIQATADCKTKGTD